MFFLDSYDTMERKDSRVAKQREDMTRNDTEGAREYAADRGNDSRSVNAHWWTFFSGYRLKQWQKELGLLMEETGLSPAQISAYTGLAHGEKTAFLAKLPAKRTSYIGIGMALGQPLDVINRWIGKYGMKRRLYAKDVTEDLVWIYLIQANMADREGKVNYYRMFDDCADAVYRTYCACWKDYIHHDADTVQVEQDLARETFEVGFENLRAFVVDHMDAFKTAYAKPRRMLADYTKILLDHLELPGREQGKNTLSDLRQYMEDSMINYLSGDPGTIHAMDRRRNDRHTLNFKHVPQGRKAHISLAMALGMTRNELDRYLELMGFTPLDAVNRDEGMLINALEEWEYEHPLQRRLKEMTLEHAGSEGPDRECAGTAEMERELAAEAVQQMLHLRQDISEAFEQVNIPCPYFAQ